MIIGAHTVLYSRKPAADRAFLRDVLKLPFVDAGEGWLIFGLPPAEVAVHPSRKNDVHELYLLCASLRRFIATMARQGVDCGPIRSMSWGSLSHVSLPGGGRLGVYEPRHPRPTGRQRSRVRVRKARSAARRPTARSGGRPSRRESRR